jgi:hypothetical protein
VSVSTFPRLQGTARGGRRPDSRQIAKALKRFPQMAPDADTAAIRTFADYRTPLRPKWAKNWMP